MNFSRLTFTVVGSAGSGKTSFVKRYVEGNFSSNYEPTIGVEIFQKNIYFNNKEITLNIVDTSGNERFEELALAYIKKSQFVLVCFSMTDRESFEKAKNWISEIKKHNLYYYIIPTKKDLHDQIQIYPDEIRNLLLENNEQNFLEISSQFTSQEDIEGIFQVITNYYILNNFDYIVQYLKEEINNGENQELIDQYQQCLSLNIDKAVLNEDLYSLPSENFYSIISNADFSDKENRSSILKTIIEKRISHNPDGNKNLIILNILQNVKLHESFFNSHDCIEILQLFKDNPFFDVVCKNLQKE